MDFDAIVLLFAGAWALLSWLARAARQRQGGEGADLDTAELERRARRAARLEELRNRRRGRAQRPAPAAQPAGEDVADELRRELERILGVRTGPTQGPLGRRAGVELPGAEEVEDLEVLEEDHDVVSLETSGERAERVVVDFDEQADALVQKRIAAAEAQSRPLSKADHARFDQRIRGQPAATVTPPARAAWPRGRRPSGSIRDAIIWSEILARPVSERSSSRSGDDNW